MLNANACRGRGSWCFCFTVSLCVEQAPCRNDRTTQRLFCFAPAPNNNWHRKGGDRLAISKEKKQQVVAELKEMLTGSKAVIISDYRGLTASQMAELRNKLRPFESRFLVAKNTLILRSLQEVGLPTPEEMLRGPTALSFCFGDLRQTLQVMQEFAKETELLRIKGGLLGERVMNVKDVQVLAELPEMEVLQAQTLASVQSPISGFVGLLDGALRGLLYVLKARAEQMGEAAA